MHARAFRSIIIFFLVAGIAAGQGVISTLVGTDWVFPSTSLSATSAPLGSIRSVAIDRAGNVYGGDCGNSFIFKVTTAGAFSILAGNGIGGFSVDGVAAGSRLICPSYLILDPAGDLLFVDASERIRKLTRDGRLVTVAGGRGASGDTGPALQAAIEPTGLAVDAAGNIYYSENSKDRVRKVTPDGVIHNFAGTGLRGFSGDGGLALNARVSMPKGLAAAADGTVYIADSNNNRIRAVTPDGKIQTFAGSGQPGSDGDRGPATEARLNSPTIVAAEGSGSVLIMENYSIRRVTPSGIISTLVEFKPGFSGDGGQLSGAAFRSIGGLASDSSGSLFIADDGNARIRMVDPTGIVRTIAGNGNWRRTSDISNPRTAWLNEPRSFALSPAGLVTFTDNFDGGTIRQLSSNGQLIRLAGALEGTGDPSRARERYLGGPGRMVFDQNGNIFFTAGCGVVKIFPDGRVVNIIGGQGCGFTGDNRPASEAMVDSPAGIAVNAAGEIFISDAGNHRIRKIGTDGVIRTIAGVDNAGFSGDGAPALMAALREPADLLFDHDGNLIFSDRGNNRVRQISPNGVISTRAGNGRAAFSGDGGAATQASLNYPNGLALGDDGALYIADTQNYRIRIVSAGGMIRTVAGNGVYGFGGDGGAASNAMLQTPFGVAVDGRGNIYIADTYNYRVRVVSRAPSTFDLSDTVLNLVADSTGTASQDVGISSAVSGLAYKATMTTDRGGSWLTVNPDTGTTPASLRVSANAFGLAPGAYSGTISINVPLVGQDSRRINVTFTVPPLQPSKLSIGSRNVPYNLTQGGEPSSIGLTVSNLGASTLNYTAEIRMSRGDNWLAVTPPTGRLSAGATSTIELTATPGSLTVGTYSAFLAVSDGTITLNVPIILSIRSPQAKLLLSQSGLTFTAVEGGGAPAPQSFGVLNEGSGELLFAAEATTLSGGEWLTLNSSIGRIIRPLQDVSFVEVVPDTRNLIQGEYQANIQVSAQGVTPQMVVVVVNVLPRGSNPGPEVRPTGLVFIGAPGSAPRSEDVKVSNIVSSAITYTSSSLTYDGGKWISHLPTAAKINPSEPQRIVVQPDFTGIAPGVKRAALYLLFEDGTSRTVNILSIVPTTAAAQNKEGNRAATNCKSPTLRSEFLSLPEGGAATVGQPVSIEVKVADDCGNLLFGNEKNTNSAVYAKFSNGDPDVRLISIGNGVWSGTWKPVNPSGGRVTVSAISVFVQGLTVQGGRSDRLVRIATGTNVPLISQLSMVNSASQKSDGLIAPGTLVTIYGNNLANVSPNSSLPLPGEADGTQVLLGGQSIPLFPHSFISPSQINTQVPFDIPVNTSIQVAVRHGNKLSLPESYVVASAQPGIFTRDATGTGQGIVMGSDQMTVADPTNPAQRGQLIVIYCTGLGLVQPNVILGAVAQSSPLAETVSPVEVLVGEKRAQVLFSGLTPGFAGLYQVNAILAADTPTGDTVPLAISITGQSSNVVSIAIR